MDTRRLVALVTGWQVVASACYYSLFAASTFLRESFGVSRFLVGVAITTLTLGYTLALFPSGALVDAYGERPILVGGLAGLAVGVVAVGLAPSYALLLPAVLVLGVAYASAMPASNRAIVSGVPPADRGMAMGLKQVGVTGGSAVAAIVVVSLAPLVATWEVGLYALGAMGATVAVLFFVFYDGSSGSGELTIPDLRGLGANRTYLALVVAGGFLGAALFTTVGYATLYLTDGVALSVGVAGVGFAAMQVSGSLGRVAAGRLTDRLVGITDWGPGQAAAGVLLGQGAVGAVLVAGLAVFAHPIVALVLLVAVGATIVGFTGVYYACLTAIVGDETVGTATAGAQVALNAGGLAAPPAFGWLADVAGFGASWTLLAGSAVVGTGFAWLAFRRLGRPASEPSAAVPE